MAPRRPEPGGRPLRAVTWKGGAAPDGGFPFDVPTVRSLESLNLDAPVTFFVGENGSGKSTLLEGIAAASGVPTVGADDTARDPSLGAQRRLGRALRLVWSARRTRGFFLRAEDFFGFQKRLARERAELHGRLDDLAVEYRDRSDYARALAEGPARASLADMGRRKTSSGCSRCCCR